jgi:hypothetical protein
MVVKSGSYKVVVFSKNAQTPLVYHIKLVNTTVNSNGKT